VRVGISGHLAPVYSRVNHFTFNPAPYDEGSAYVGVKIFKCRFKLAHAATLQCPPLSITQRSHDDLTNRSAFGMVAAGAERQAWGAERPSQQLRATAFQLRPGSGAGAKLQYSSDRHLPVAGHCWVGLISNQQTTGLG
jgi:hypothetical protein